MGTRGCKTRACFRFAFPGARPALFVFSADGVIDSVLVRLRSSFGFDDLPALGGVVCRHDHAVRAERAWACWRHLECLLPRDVLLHSGVEVRQVRILADWLPFLQDFVLLCTHVHAFTVLFWL